MGKTMDDAKITLNLSLDPISKIEEDLLFEAGDEEQLVRRNMRLIVKVVKTFPYHITNLMYSNLADVLGEGIILLIESIRLHDPNEGKLSTFATNRIKWGLSDWASRNLFPLKIPRRVLCDGVGVLPIDDIKYDDGWVRDFESSVYHAIKDSRVIVTASDGEIESRDLFIYLAEQYMNGEPSVRVFLTRLLGDKELTTFKQLSVEYKKSIATVKRLSDKGRRIIQSSLEEKGFV